MQFESVATDTTMQFREVNYSQIFEIAKQEQKDVLLYFCFYGCGPCKKMENTTFKNKKVIEFIDSNYVSFKVNIGKDYGIEINKNYHIKQFPAFIFLDAEGKLIHKIIGFYEPKEFIVQALNAHNLTNSLSSLKQQYKNGNRESGFLFEYTYKLRNANELDSLVVNEYLLTQTINDLSLEKNIKYIYEFAINKRNFYISFGSRAYQFMDSNRSLFESYFDLEQVDTRLMFITQREVYRAINMKDKDSFYKALESLKKYDTGQDYNFKEMNGGITMWTYKKALIRDAEIAFYESMEDIEKYNETVDLYVSEVWNDSEALNIIAWRYYEGFYKIQNLELAIKCVKRSIELNSNYNNNDTYAALLFKMGKYELALKQAENAIVLAKKDNIDFQETTKLIEKINEKEK